MMPSPVVLGLDFGGTKIAIAVADPAGNRLGDRTILTRSDEDAKTTFDRGLLLAHELLAEVAPGRPLAAVGAGTFGIPAEDRVELAPTIPGWEELAFGRELRRAFDGAEIRLATDVKAAALAEADSGALVGCDPAIYLNLGTGLAAAIVAHGSVIHGSNGAAGEIGYNLRTTSDVGLGLGSRIPLEQAVSGQVLDRVSGSNSHCADSAAHGRHRRRAILPEEFITELCFHLVNLTIAIDPKRIAVGGGMVRSWWQFGARLRAALDAAVPFPPDLVVSAFPYDAPLIGVLALATAAAREAGMATSQT
jgi:glucokinase